MAAQVDGLQEPYLAVIDLLKYEHLNIYGKAIVGLPESERYDLTIYKWTSFYPKLEDAVYKF